MTPEDEEFNRIEREAKQRMEAVSAALDKKAENARELGLNYEPVCNKDPQGCWNVRCQLGKKCKNTPAQRTWVGLTAGEVFDVLVSVDKETVRLPSMLGIFARAIEAKLREKNT